MTEPFEALIAEMKAAAELSKELSGINRYTKAEKAKSDFTGVATEENVLLLIAALEQSQTKLDATEAVALALRDDSRLKDKSIAELEKQYEDRVPTEWAYNQACKALQSHKDEIAELKASQLAVKLSSAATDVLAERERQIEKKGYTESRDDQYLPGVLNLAGAAYAVSVSAIPDAKRRAQRLWPWPDAGKYLDSSPKAPRPALIKAAALIVAEIERIDRAGGTVQGDE